MAKRRSIFAGLVVVAVGLGVIGAIVSWVVQDASPSRARSGGSGEADADEEPGESLVPIPDPSTSGESWIDYVPGYALADELGEAAGRAWSELWSD